MNTRLSSESKPLRGTIIEADFFQWPTKDKKFVLCVTGYLNHVSQSNSIRTSWIEKTIETEDGELYIETRNSKYRVEPADDQMWNLLKDNLKHENLDVERMKQ